MRVLDLFSGIGGFTLGLERAGMKTIAFCEKEEFCRKVLEKNWPGVKIHDDICELDGKKYRGAIDLICGGFPCQDISVARGKNAKGLDGEKSGLWFEYKRIIGQSRPRFVIVENTSALLSRGLSAVLSDLAALGYDAQWHCIPASAIGAPHQRDRIWIVAYPSGKSSDASQWPEKFAVEMAKAIAGANSDRFKTEHKIRQWIFSTSGRYWQQTMPKILGVGDGVPNWSHRVKSLGNSVVPQIPELIGRCILQSTKQ